MREWRIEEDEYIIANFGHRPTELIAEVLHRKAKSVLNRAACLQNEGHYLAPRPPYETIRDKSLLAVKLYQGGLALDRVAVITGLSKEEVLHSVAMDQRQKRKRKEERRDRCDGCCWRNTGRPCVWPAAMCGMETEKEGG